MARERKGAGRRISKLCTMTAVAVFGIYELATRVLIELAAADVCAMFDVNRDLRAIAMNETFLQAKFARSNLRSPHGTPVSNLLRAYRYHARTAHALKSGRAPNPKATSIPLANESMAWQDELTRIATGSILWFRVATNARGQIEIFIRSFDDNIIDQCDSLAPGFASNHPPQIVDQGQKEEETRVIVHKIDHWHFCRPLPCSSGRSGGQCEPEVLWVACDHSAARIVRIYLTGHQQGAIHILDYFDQKLLHEMRHEQITSYKVLPSFNRLATVSGDGKVFIWCLNTGTRIASFVVDDLQRIRHVKNRVLWCDTLHGREFRSIEGGQLSEALNKMLATANPDLWIGFSDGVQVVCATQKYQSEMRRDWRFCILAVDGTVQGEFTHADATHLMPFLDQFIVTRSMYDEVKVWSKLGEQLSCFELDSNHAYTKMAVDSYANLVFLHGTPASFQQMTVVNWTTQSIVRQMAHYSAETSDAPA